MPVLEVKVSGKMERKKHSGVEQVETGSCKIVCCCLFLIISCDITLGNSGELAASLKIS